MNIKFINEKKMRPVYGRMDMADKINLGTEIRAQRNDAVLTAIELVKLVQNKDPIEVLKYISETWAEMDALLQHVLVFPAMYPEYTIGQLIIDTIDKQITGKSK